MIEVALLKAMFEFVKNASIFDEISTIKDEYDKTSKAVSVKGKQKFGEHECSISVSF